MCGTHWTKQLLIRAACIRSLPGYRLFALWNLCQPTPSGQYPNTIIQFTTRNWFIYAAGNLYFVIWYRFVVTWLSQSMYVHCCASDCHFSVRTNPLLTNWIGHVDTNPEQTVQAVEQENPSILHRVQHTCTTGWYAAMTLITSVTTST